MHVCVANRIEIRSNLKRIIGHNSSERMDTRDHHLGCKLTPSRKIYYCVVASDRWWISAWRMLITQQNGFYAAIFTLLICCFPLIWPLDNNRQNITTYYKCRIVLPSKNDVEASTLMTVHDTLTHTRTHVMWANTLCSVRKINSMVKECRSPFNWSTWAMAACKRIKWTVCSFLQVWDFEWRNPFKVWRGTCSFGHFFQLAHRVQTSIKLQ